MVDGGDEGGVGYVVGQLDGQDYMVESANVCRHFRSDRAALRIDDYVVRLDANLAEHGAEQRGLVFAVSVAVGEDFRRRMGLVAADPELNGDVADIMLHELS